MRQTLARRAGEACQFGVQDDARHITDLRHICVTHCIPLVRYVYVLLKSYVPLPPPAMNDAYLGYLQRKPRRMTMTIPDAAFRQLLQLSDEQGRSLSNLAAFLLESSLEEYQRRHGRDGRDSG